MNSLKTADPLWDAIRAAHERWSPDTAKQFPPAPEWEPAICEAGTGFPIENQRVNRADPTAPTVPTPLEDEWGWVPTSSVEECAEREERAAILEFEGGLDRETAERLAALTASS